MSLKTLLVVDPVKASAETYAGPIMDAASRHFRTRFASRVRPGELHQLASEADAIWVDWCTDEIVSLSHTNHVKKPVIVRVHAFEVLEGGYAGTVAWENVMAVVAVSPHIATLLRSQVPDIDSRTSVHVIPNGVDLDRFVPSSRFSSSDIAWVGVVAPKKNPFVALHVLKELAKRGKDYRLHVAGDVANTRAAMHFNYLAKSLGLSDRVFQYGHVKDMPAWYADKGVLLSTSLYESFGFAIAEASAAGLWPVVLDFPNAEDLWPRAMIVQSISEACDKICDARQGAYRNYVANRYSIDIQLALLDELFLQTSIQIDSQAVR